MIPEDLLLTSDREEPAELTELAKEARAYLEYHTWCKGVEKIDFALGFSKVAVFHCRIKPRPGEGQDLFVIVGDIPPLYLDLEDAPTAHEALEMYVDIMIALCDTYEDGESLDEYPPLRERGSWRVLEPNNVMIKALRGRMSFIERNLVTDDIE
jgi:hypothetical protein